MKTDLYTKIVLTVIAVFLGVIVFQNISLVPTAQAAAAPIPDPAPAKREIVDVNIVQIRGYEVKKRTYASDEGILPIAIWDNLDK